MTFYTYFGEDVPESEPPKRVYASLDSTEPDLFRGADKFIAFFEAIDADSFDHGEIEPHPILAGQLDRSVSILKVHIDQENISLFGDMFERDPEDDAPNWVQLVFDPEGPLQVEQYLNLFGNAIPRSTNVVFVPPNDALMLSAFFGIDDIEDSSEDEILSAIGVPDRDAAVVYDVGQGNCNAVVGSDQAPQVYFDFGGGVIGHSNTYPSGLTDFCFAKNPSIVLSHWDWDHWSSAQRTKSAAGNANAIAAPWIVPRQRLGPVHRGFFAKLGTVKIWPNTLAQVHVGGVTIQKCTGPRSNRNHSGLAMVFEPSWAQASGVLFTGDCDYRFIPATLGNQSTFDALVVPHHGGRHLPNTHIPQPALGAQYLRLCISCGRPNQYGHPDAGTINQHVASGWATTSHLHTSTRTQTPPGPAGHIWLDPQAQVISQPPCQYQNCQTALVQA